MATSKTNQRARYAHLLTQQCRVRHLTSIAARNLVLNIESTANRDVTDIQTYFTLHSSEATASFYKSEYISGSLNPTWRSFDLKRQNEENITSSPNIVIRVWAGNCKTFRLVCEWKVDLSGLVLLGDQIQKDGGKYEKNSLIFGMFDAYYGAPPESKTEQEQEIDVLQCALKVDQAAVRMSYNLNSLLRIQTVLRAIKQTRAMASRIRTHISDKLTQSQNTTKKMSECERLVLSVNKMREDLVWRSMHLQKERDSYEHLVSNNHQRRLSLGDKYESLEEDFMYNKKKTYFQSREEYVKTNAQLVMRRKQLISELVFIYPIVEEQNVFTICSLRLPNSEDFYGQDDMMIAVTLGYTCHLVQMISHFLDVPLRYPIIHRVSRSMIHDHILDKLSDKEKDFPLFSKGKEKFQFNYGVYLLNKNIAQLRYYCGLGTTDLRLTLPNLRTLLELRLGVKFESNNMLIPGQTLSATPTLSSPSSTSLSTAHPTAAPHHANNYHNTDEDDSEEHATSIHGSNPGSSSHGDVMDDGLPPTFRKKKKRHKNHLDSQSLNSEHSGTSKNSDDETDASSSEGHSNRLYKSKFKHWPGHGQTATDSKIIGIVDSQPDINDISKTQSKHKSSHLARDADTDRQDIQKRTEMLSSSKPFKPKKSKKSKENN